MDEKDNKTAEAGMPVILDPHFTQKDSKFKNQSELYLRKKRIN